MNVKLITASIITASLLTACGGGGSAAVATPVNLINVDNVQKVLDTNADIALATYEDSVATAKLLQTALVAFQATPTTATFDAAKTAWLVSREPYGQSEVYRFRNSPIDDDFATAAAEDGPEGDINAWPLGEALIDYTVTGTDFGDDQLKGAPEDGETAVELGGATNIISASVTIDTALISGQASGNDVIAGYHAIEFMLWGQDLNADGSADTLTTRELSTTTVTSGGHRPLTDFTTDANRARRFKYLEVVAAKLVSDLEGVRDGWEAGAAYRTSFTTIANETEAKQKLAEILTGMATMSEGELAGERMQIAFTTNSQEDEHSCFSDNTHRDIWLDAEGVANAYFGDYAGYDSTLNGSDDVVTSSIAGYGLDDYIADLGVQSLTDLAASLVTAFEATKAGYESIDTLARAGTPVDVQIITPADADPMFTTILALNDQANLIANLATALELGATVLDPDASECDPSDPLTACP